MLSNTQIIILITAIVSIAAFSSTTIKEQLLFKPVLIQKRNEWYRFFTSGLIHADWEHLLFNMLTLYLFGEGLEAQFNSDNLFGEKGAILYSTFGFPFFNDYFLLETQAKQSICKFGCIRSSKCYFICRNTSKSNNKNWLLHSAARYSWFYVWTCLSTTLIVFI